MWRVSSARIKSADLRVFITRRVMSSRLPMGVGQIYSMGSSFTVWISWCLI